MIHSTPAAARQRRERAHAREQGTPQLEQRQDTPQLEQRQPTIPSRVESSCRSLRLLRVNMSICAFGWLLDWFRPSYVVGFGVTGRQPARYTNPNPSSLPCDYTYMCLPGCMNTGSDRALSVVSSSLDYARAELSLILSKSFPCDHSICAFGETIKQPQPARCLVFSPLQKFRYLLYGTRTIMPDDDTG